MNNDKEVSLWQLFLTFSKIGAFTIGGGYMMVPAIEAEILKQGWIDEEEMPDIVALSQSAPGLLTVNMAIFSGYRIRGLAGSIVSTIGCLIAPFFIILLIAMFFSSFRNLPFINSMFMGVRPVAVGIILGYAWKLCRKHSNWWEWALTIGTLAAIVMLKISAIYILLTVIVLSTALLYYRERRAGR